MVISLIILAAIAFAASVALFVANKNNKTKFAEVSLQLEEAVKENAAMLVKKTEAETRLESLKNQTEQLNEQLRIAAAEKESAIEEKSRYRREQELAMQKLEIIESEMRNWQKTKEEHIQITKASIVEMGNHLSSKLLDDHKRETEAAKQQSDKLVKQTTEDLHKKFQNVFESMSTLHDKVSKADNAVELVRRSLLSPSGAGSLSEIALANIFEASGLTEGRDYFTQYSLKNNEGQGLRPDAVVMLPENNMMVVDSKASKFFLEIGENEAGREALSASLKQSMNRHLKDLMSRDYKAAIQEKFGNSHITMVMFLPTEAALENLRNIDPAFMEKAIKENIIPVGPSGLVNLLWQANSMIINAQQEQNAQRIIMEVKELLTSVAKLHELAGAVGKNLKNAFSKYDEFAGSFNRNFISKAKKIDRLGAGNVKIKEIKQLERYSIDAKEIESEAVEEEVALVEAS